MKTFQEFKDHILGKAQENDACSSQFRRAAQSETAADLLAVIRENITWCYCNKTVTIEDLEFYPKEELQAVGIYINYHGEIRNQDVFLLNSTVKAWGNSTVEAWGNSTVEAWGNSTVEAWENSTVEAWENSTVEAWENSTVKAWENSTVRGLGKFHSRGLGKFHSRGLGKFHFDVFP
jgi:hypothetical protein